MPFGENDEISIKINNNRIKTPTIRDLNWHTEIAICYFIFDLGLICLLKRFYSLSFAFLYTQNNILYNFIISWLHTKYEYSQMTLDTFQLTKTQK